MNWFKDNFMQANPEKFQFMFLKKYTSKEIVPKFIEIHGTERFDTHVNNLCKKAARQINVMY